MDSTDRQLLSLLRDNARLPVAALAKTLRVARGTLMTVAVEGNRTDEVLRALRGDPAVCALHTTNGRWDIVAELRTDSLEAVDKVLSRIRLIDGISNTETSLLLSTHKY